MNQPQNIDHYASVSDDIFVDTGARDPSFPEIYKRLRGFDLGSTNAWTRGQPFDYYKRMREESPVMWTPGRKPTSGFWSVSRYEDIKRVELDPKTFSSQRGSMHMAVVAASGKADRLMHAAHNSLINLDADVHRDLRLQQSEFFFPKYVETLKERVGKKIDDLLDNMER
ncbi:MAG: cytochrome P450, partial [Halieaceae bacterium]|nr:cytochrome P450 [Halieaceae bacterium]